METSIVINLEQYGLTVTNFHGQPCGHDRYFGSGWSNRVGQIMETDYCRRQETEYSPIGII